MAGESITQRVRMHFERERQWMDEASRGLDYVLDALEGPAEMLEEALRLHKSLWARIETLRHEQAGLRREWQAAKDVAPEDRRQVQHEAEMIQALSTGLEAKHLSVLEAIERQAAMNQAELGRLRRGRTVLDGYRPGETGGPGYIDKKS
ncbi:MAG: hypothetical protein HYV26_01990 [Candidatus Hydrogenedentes bacterium]|nr:hypothetical protein [Candidatus Hydrogenedentota bacterium]